MIWSMTKPTKSHVRPVDRSVCAAMQSDQSSLGRAAGICLFECFLRSQSTTTVMSRQSINLSTLFLGRLRPKRFIQILSAQPFTSNWQPVTDNCPTWISGRERIAVAKDANLLQTESKDWANVLADLSLGWPESLLDAHVTLTIQTVPKTSENIWGLFRNLF